jgi:hypothetical protein
VCLKDLLRVLIQFWCSYPLKGPSDIFILGETQRISKTAKYEPTKSEERVYKFSDLNQVFWKSMTGWSMRTQVFWNVTCCWLVQLPCSWRVYYLVFMA